MDEEESSGGIPEWVVTFGDMMSLLLTFFIMLVSMSEIKEEERFRALVESMRRQFGHARSVAAMAPGDFKPRNSKLLKLSSEGRAKRLSTETGGDKVKAAVGEEPRVQNLRPAEPASAAFVLQFEAGSVELDQQARDALDRAVEQFRGKQLKIEVRGHASLRPLPSQTAYRDHWDLAYARARAVVEYMVEQGIDSRRLVLVDAAQNEPLQHDDLELIGRNDRVEVQMLNEAWQRRSGTPRERKRRLFDSGDVGAP